MLRPIGFNLEIAFSLIPAMAAREVAVSSLATIYAVAEADVDAKMGAIIAANWSLPTALAFLAWFVFAPQCLSTFAIIRKETNSWKWPLLQLVGMSGIAYLAAFIAFQVLK
jgi:ferrous iron transport protein B